MSENVWDLKDEPIDEGKALAESVPLSDEDRTLFDRIRRFLLGLEVQTND